ncbi:MULTISPECIES: outer membrane protein assembly factor BamA [Halocynthiibacter]|uniref:Outer membrane protein assembly factor BamA n=1 Tax=Halocynthiibacter halioticoli TaxID=2986804 RepID=A0AAE3J071_9RHOB|nr:MULTISPECIES: outer membrane protein assembly factor BamA [Halocynthiibacter]MCV6824315.1 outer membrane protein assembly factor BamA [Halocynthiibacter halioticoli]MCW4057316.1 outer membrane protein assembly factor BamA [Halocynthiibacter sp. SDUM655004]
MSGFVAAVGTHAKSGAGQAISAWMRRFAALVFLCVSVVYTVAPTAAQAQNYTFSNVQIDGAIRVDQATVISYLGIERGKPVSTSELNDGYQRLVRSGLFETVEITPQGNTLRVQVREWPTINQINIEGNKRLKDDVLLEVVRSQPRLVYNPTLAEQDAFSITEAYEVSGRLAATVTPKIIRRSDNRVDLVFEVTEGKTVEIERLSFLGNRVYSDRRLRRVLETKQAGLLRTFVQADTFVADRIEFDKQILKEFYNDNGYIDFQTLSVTSELAQERDGVFLTFRIREGQQFRVGRVSVVSEIPEADPADFERQNRLRTGKVYSPLTVEASVTRMENLALKKGYSFVRVEPRITRNSRNRTLDIQLALVRGPRVFVERIDIEGNTTTLDRVIRREFRTVEGDPYNPREIQQAQERIEALGYFATTDVSTREGSSPDRVIVDVDVEETTTGTLGLGLAYSTNDGFGINATYDQRNFLGRGQRLGLGISTAAQQNSYRFSFYEPSIFSRELGFGLDLSYVNNQNDNLFYKTTTGKFRPYLDFPVSDRGRVRLNYEYENTDVYDVDRDNSSRIIVKDEGRRRDNSIGYYYTFDTRRSKIDEDFSFVARFGQDFGLNDVNPFVRSTALVGMQTTILNDLITIRAVAEGGAIGVFDGGSTKVVDRFYMGTNVMRGFESYGIGPRDLNVPNEDALGGNMYAVMRLEADFPLGIPEEYGISGGVFLDVGSVWSLDDTNGGPANGACPVADCTVDDSLRLRSVVGFALYWDTPIGPLRFNFTKALQKESYDKEQQFEFTISTEF